MRKFVLSLAGAGLLAAVAVASPARGQVPPPPPPPNGGTPLPTIGLPCPPTGCPTSTPTTTPTPAATLTPTATATPAATSTSTPIPLFVQAKLAHSKVKAGQKQKVTVTTVGGTYVKIVLSYPNHSSNTHIGVANDAGTLSWTFKQPNNKTTAKSRTVKVTVTVSTNVANQSAHKKYTIG